LPALLLAAVLVLAQSVLAAVRWHLLMRYLGLSIALTRTLQIFWIGQFATALLPGGVAGDGVRMWVLTRDGTKASTSINSVILDRAVALTGLFLLVAASLPFADDRVAPAPVRYGVAAFLVIGIAVALGIGVLLRLPARWQGYRAARAVAALSDDLRTVCRVPTHAVGLVVLSLIGIGCNILTLFVLLRSLGVALGLADCMVLAPLVILATTLPISLGGWGIREGSTVGLFSLIGVAPAISLTSSIVIGLLSTAVSIPGILVWLQWTRATRANEKPDRVYPAASGADL
jgi:glycosyltransferase 2 family protein